jgi:hypothetical protein
VIVLAGALCVPCVALLGVAVSVGAAAPLYAALVLALVAAALLPLGVLARGRPARGGPATRLARVMPPRDGPGS